MGDFDANPPPVPALEARAKTSTVAALGPEPDGSDRHRPREEPDDGAVRAGRETVEHLCYRSTASSNEASTLGSLVGDRRVTRTVDGVMGCHGMPAEEHRRPLLRPGAG